MTWCLDFKLCRYSTLYRTAGFGDNSWEIAVCKSMFESRIVSNPLSSHACSCMLVFFRPLGTLADRAIYFACVNFFFFYFLFFFTMSKAISVSTGPIIIIFSPNGSNLLKFSRSGPVFPIPQGTLPWQPILWQNYLPSVHLSLQHAETEWDIATSMYALTV